MPKTLPWNSVKQKVYHDNSCCPVGRAIEIGEFNSGTAGKPLCPECWRLDLAGK